MRKNCLKSLLVALIISALVISSMVVNAATPTGTRLKNIQSRVLVGTEFPSGFTTMSDSATFTSTGAAEFNLVTPENAMKWDATESSQNNFNYTEADKLVSWAQSNNFKVHGHTLVWHSQTPSWVQGLNASAMQSAMYSHIDNVMGHFKGKILVWDVVNEAFNEDGSYRSSFWYNTLGKSFIENAFIRARAADSGAKLVYNDYNLEYTGSKSNAAYNMLKDLKSRGIPVDGIGFQMHLDIQYGFNYDDFASNMQRFADLGLEIYITEMDVRVSSNPSSAELQTQADYYRGVIQKCMAQPAVKAIQVWGFTDKYSWVPGTFPGRGAALIFDSNYNAKPSYYAMQSALGGSSATSTPTPAQTPTPTPTSPTGNLVTNPGIETGNTSGWAVNGAGSIAVSTAQKHSGTYSLLHTGRTATWNGPLQNLTSKVQNGKTYACSGWVRLDNAASGSIIMTIKKVDGSGTTYTNIATGTGNNSSWVQLSGNYTLNVTGTLTELSIYFEGPNSGVSYYIDDVSVQ